MKKKTYKNDYGETMDMKFQQILTIDHEDIGMLYLLPNPDEGWANWFTLSYQEIDTPIGKKQMPIFCLAILNENERSIIDSHFNQEGSE